MIESGSVEWSESISILSQPLQLAPTSSNDVVTLQFTSGSTGSAKAVPLTDQMQNDRFMSGFSVEHVAFAFQPPVLPCHP
jgi:acyl-coenzyme A synthetase/AMP-(fatty) acid ligase